MSDVVYRSAVRIERVKGPVRRAYLPAEAAPVIFGVHDEIADREVGQRYRYALFDRAQFDTLGRLHVLGEVEQIADWVGIIHEGRLIFQGELASLKKSHAGTLEDIFLRLVAPEETAG